MTESAIDIATFKELQDSAGADFVNELVETFFEEAPVMLGELRSARAAANANAFRRAAHSLKSNCHTFGAMTLGAMARELESKGLDADPARDGIALDAMAAAYAQAAAELKVLCHG